MRRAVAIEETSVAVIDADEADHQACIEALEELELPLVTTRPAATEAMDPLGGAGGIEGGRVQ